MRSFEFSIFVAMLALVVQVKGNGEVTMNNGTMHFTAKDFEFYTHTTNVPLATLTALVDTVTAMQKNLTTVTGEVAILRTFRANVLAATCPSNEFIASFSEDGSPVCSGLDISKLQARVTGTCTAGQHASGVNQDGSLVCTADVFAASTACPTGQVVSGFDASGSPTCVADADTSPDPTKWQQRIGSGCASGQYVSSVKQDGSLVCVSDVYPATTCAGGQVVSGFDSTTGDPICVADDDTPDPAVWQKKLTSSCKVDEALRGFDASGAPTCNTLPDISNLQKRVAGTCQSGQFATAVNSDGTLVCTADKFPTTSCTDSQVVSGFSTTGSPICVVAAPDATKWQARVTGTCATGQHASGVNQDGSLVCTADVFAASTACPTGQVVSGFDASGAPTCVSASSSDPTAWQQRISTACPSGQFMQSVAQDGTATCVAALATDSCGNTLIPAAEGKSVLIDNIPVAQSLRRVDTGLPPPSTDVEYPASRLGSKLTSGLSTTLGISANVGYSVAISGKYAIAGARGQRQGSFSNAGGAFIYELTAGSGTTATWTQRAALKQPSTGTSDYFGQSVGISDNYAVVGAYGDDTAGTNSGSVFLFLRSGTSWSLVGNKAITRQNAKTSDNLGFSVAIDGTTFVAGAYTAEATGKPSASGMAIVWTVSGTTVTQQAELSTNDAAGSDYFGYAVDISGNIIVGGAYLEDPEAQGSAGSAYVFQRTGTAWTQIYKLIAPNFGSGDYFGFAVSISGMTVAVGAYNEDTKASNAGAVYTFDLPSSSDCVQGMTVSMLVDRLATSSDYFGRSVSISGNVLVAGAYAADTGGSAAGDVEVFTRPFPGGAWTQRTTLLNYLSGSPDTTQSSDYFGWAVALDKADSSKCIVGARLDDPNGSSSGSALVFESSA